MYFLKIDKDYLSNRTINSRYVHPVSLMLYRAIHFFLKRPLPVLSTLSDARGHL